MKQLLLCIIISLSLSNCGWYDSYQYTAADGVKVNLVYMPGCGGSSSYQHESKPYSTDSYECSTHDFIKGFYGCATAKKYCQRNGHRYSYCTCGIIPEGCFDCRGYDACYHPDGNCHIHSVKCIVSDTDI